LKTNYFIFRCKKAWLYDNIKKIICSNDGCNKRLLKKDLENHVKNEYEHTLIKCQYCDYKFNKKILNHMKAHVG